MFDTLTRYILKRTGLRFLLLFAVFMGVMVGGQIALLLGRGVSPEACLPMMNAFCMLAATIALPVSFASAILVVVGGMVQDGEFRALASSGVGHRRVLVRLTPLIIGAVLLTSLLTHVILPAGMADYRANQGRLFQTAIASKAAENEPILDNKGMSVWVSGTEGSRLEDVRLLLTHGDEFIGVYAPTARWVLADQGIHLECEDVQVLVRSPGKHLMTMDTERYTYQINNDLSRRDRVNPDAMSTSEVLALTHQVPKPNERQGTYNDARLTLHFRFFLPLSLIAFALLAMGMGLAFGTDQNLPGVLLIVVIVAAALFPAFGYVKNKSNLPQIDSGFLLWPPGAVIAVVGAWMAWNPDRAKEVLHAPLDWWATRRAKRT